VLFEIVKLCVAPDEKRELDVFQMLPDARVPERGAFRPGRPVASFRVASRVAEAHRHDRDLRFIVKLLG
jgi:hypothetical protein